MSALVLGSVCPSYVGSIVSVSVEHVTVLHTSVTVYLSPSVHCWHRNMRARVVGVGVSAVSMFVQCSAPVPVLVRVAAHVKAVPGRAGLITAYLTPTSHNTPHNLGISIIYSIVTVWITDECSGVPSR